MELSNICGFSCFDESGEFVSGMVVGYDEYACTCGDIFDQEMPFCIGLAFEFCAQDEYITLKGLAFVVKNKPAKAAFACQEFGSAAL
mgnify:CR=1 FL=1